MATTLASNRVARDATLARVKKALGKSGDRTTARADAERYMAARTQGPRPAMPAGLVDKFLQRATDMQSTVERISARTEIPGAVARYLDALVLPPALAAQQSRAGVCWPEFADLDWALAGLAIAETGTLVVLSGAETPTASTLLPDTHIAVVRPDRVVSGMEEAFDLVRRERGAMPRAMNMISGPSRTGDIEQTIQLGAHGPFRVHILLVG